MKESFFSETCATGTVQLAYIKSLSCVLGGGGGDDGGGGAAVKVVGVYLLVWSEQKLNVL